MWSCEIVIVWDSFRMGGGYVVTLHRNVDDNRNIALQKLKQTRPWLSQGWASVIDAGPVLWQPWLPCYGYCRPACRVATRFQHSLAHFATGRDQRN